MILNYPLSQRFLRNVDPALRSPKVPHGPSSEPTTMDPIQLFWFCVGKLELDECLWSAKVVPNELIDIIVTIAIIPKVNI